ncbi:DUF2378 family protein [Hyalangium gracile]|uniref:DUF2378 family protein n=1 Tax=Hyalangium gracile TaxID=394092 RepID=UPI001CCBEF7F|nr:DUF2378 family protein [Hyalangium gracile]
MTHTNVAATSAAGGVESDYERRIALATPEDTARGLFFNGILNAVITFGGEPALKRCHGLLNDKRFERRFIDFSSYPVSDFLRLALAATQVLSMQLGGPEPTQRRLGMQATRDFLGSMAGRTLLLLSGDSPKRVMGNLASGYRSAVSYGERTVTLLSDTSARVVVKRDFMLPLYNEGVLLAVLESVHIKNPQVRSRPTGVLDCEYELSWG